MMPVPTHLVECVHPRDDLVDESPLEGDVRCPCGLSVFDVLYPGATLEYQGALFPCTAENDGEFYFLIKARCAACRREHLLFDKDFHGWDGFVCHDARQAALPRPALTERKCLACGKTAHELAVLIPTQGKAEFLEGNEGERDESRWQDAFDWYSMSIRCLSCGKETPEWVSYEAG